jgi:hypothetical protein
MKSLNVLLFCLLIGCKDGVQPASTVLPSEAGKVIPISAMSTTRAVHTATLLLNGKVLITGGFNAAGHTLATAELFDPQSQTFASTGTMNVPRLSHTATLLPYGKVLIAGGLNGGWLNSAELYDPATGRFTLTGQLSTPRSDHVAVMLTNGKVLLVAGVGAGYTFLATTELYDPSTGDFMPSGSLSIPRESHTATLLANGMVLVAGGHQGRRAAITVHSSAELYDPVSGSFSQTGSMTIRRHKHDATRLSDGKILISGGSDERDDQGKYTSSEIYDPITGSFTVSAIMNAARYKHAGTSVLLQNDKVLLIGGASVTEVYDSGTNRFGVIQTSIAATRLFAATTLLSNGNVLFTGGYGPNISADAQAWIFLP